MIRIRTVALSSALSFSLACAGTAFAQAAPTPADEQAAYEASIERRVGETVTEMKLDDPAKAELVKEKFKQQLRDLRAWHAEHYARYRELQVEFEKLDKELKGINKAFIKEMESQLTTEQVDLIRERMVGGRYQHNIGGLNAEYPDLPDWLRNRAIEMWQEARDIAMVLPEGKDKTQVFERYKGRVNNYISAKGYKGKSWHEKQARKAAAAATQPTTAPAQP
jgi:hypothetical protein